MKSVDLFRTVLGTDADQIRINPLDPIRKMIRPGGTLTRHEFQVLAEGRIPAEYADQVEKIAFQAGQQIFIGVPAEEPAQKLLAALVSTAESDDNINALYLFQIAWQKNQSWNTQKVIGIQLLQDLDQSQVGEIIRKLGQNIRSFLSENEFWTS